MTNIHHAADIIADAFRPGFGGAAPAIGRDLAHLLADAGALAPGPQIIRTRDELAALDPDSLILDCTGHLMTNRDRLPAVVIATGDQVRAARRALEDPRCR